MSVVLGSLLTLVVLAGVLSPSASAAALPPQELLDQHVVLPLAQASDAVYAASADRVLVSGAALLGADDPNITGDDPLVVASPDGSSLTSLPLSGVTDLALDPDGTHVWAAVPGADEIAVVDTTTWDVATHPTGAGTCPAAVAPARSGTVWFAVGEGNGCDGNGPTVRSLDVPSGEVTPALPDLASSDLWGKVQLTRVPGHHQVVLSGSSNNGAVTLLADTDTASVLASRALAISDPTIASDGASLVTPQGARYALPTLADDGDLGLPEGFGPYVYGDGIAAATVANEAETVDLSTKEPINELMLDPAQALTIQKSVFTGGPLVLLAVRSHVIWMFHEDAPFVPAPRLTIDDLTPVATQPTDVTGTLLEGDTAVAGVTVSVYDAQENLLGTAVTDDSGAWALEHAFTTSGFQRIHASTSAEGDRKASYALRSLTVQKLSADITADIPTTLAIGETTDVTGMAQVADEPAAQTAIHWIAYCLQGDASTQGGQVTTADDGTFTVHLEPGRCARVDLELSMSGSDVQDGASTYGYIDIPWHVSTITMDASQYSTVGEETHAVLTVLRDGEPAAGLPVHLNAYAPFVGNLGADGVTDANGQADLAVTFDTATVYDVYASTDGDDDTLSSSTHTTWVVGRVPSSIALSAPQQATVGDDVVVTGTLDRSGGPVGGLTVHLTATDQDGAATMNGAIRNSTTTTAQDGTFIFHDQPVASGTTRYAATVAGTDTYDDATGGVFVDVARMDQKVTLTTDRKRYDGGDHVALSIGLSAGSNSSVTVFSETADDSEGAPVYQGPVPAGGLTVHPVVRHTTTFTAITTSDLQHTGSIATITRAVKPRLQLSLPTRAHPGRFVATLRSPRRAQVCVSFLLSRYRHGSWHLVHQASCRRTDDSGTAVWRDKGRYPTGPRYRIRASFRGDELNMATRTPWVEFRFR